jgi:hypothetical protein
VALGYGFDSEGDCRVCERIFEFFEVTLGNLLGKVMRIGVDAIFIDEVL